jgi:GMP synthase-like glutamine amidotransferase
MEAKEWKPSNLSSFSFATGHSAEYCQRVYGGYGSLFVKLLKDPDEIWDEILVIEGQLPTAEDLDKYDGFIVTGSRHDAHGEEEWIERLCGILKQIHEKQKKLLGVCFGHQVR